MWRYQAAALALKAFSLTPATRTSYRKLGSWLQNRKEIADLDPYASNSAWLFSRIREAGLLDGRPLRALEIGTGWMHFYGLSLALAADVRIDLQDVWDNRQFHRLQSAIGILPQYLPRFGLTEAEMARTLARLEKIAAAPDLDAIYETVGARYVIDDVGDLQFLEPATYDVIFSMDVLEHVHANAIERLIINTFRALKPGGYVLHQIGHDDHLAHYDGHASHLQFLKYGDLAWRLRFANTVQYFNRIGFDCITEMFATAGFQSVETARHTDFESIRGMPVAQQYRDRAPEDLATTRGFVVYRKPL